MNDNDFADVIAFYERLKMHREKPSYFYGDCIEFVVDGVSVTVGHSRVWRGYVNAGRIQECVWLIEELFHRRPRSILRGRQVEDILGKHYDQDQMGPVYKALRDAEWLYSWDGHTSYITRRQMVRALRGIPKKPRVRCLVCRKPEWRFQFGEMYRIPFYQRQRAGACCSLKCYRVLERKRQREYQRELKFQMERKQEWKTLQLGHSRLKAIRKWLRTPGSHDPSLFPNEESRPRTTLPE